MTNESDQTGIWRASEIGFDDYVGNNKTHDVLTQHIILMIT